MESTILGFTSHKNVISTKIMVQMGGGNRNILEHIFYIIEIRLELIPTQVFKVKMLIVNLSTFNKKTPQNIVKETIRQ